MCGNVQARPPDVCCRLLTIAAVSPASVADMKPRLLLVALKSHDSTAVISFMAAAAAAPLAAAASEPGPAAAASEAYCLA